MATHCSILAWKKNSMDRGDWQATVHGVAKREMAEHAHTHSNTGVSG